ncbi:hypothetical protein VIGAN_10060500 [Vigna angularis var. angularis]|uniref:Uncharacterized protein n=1 Tax=Vigna angularis var. angularis TaxID=157739 RepID=A0A0S3T1T8_PHAAN|nr:hypothetical protein VIGAN_10060500 [Vigna angularis var. angularis]
MYPKVKVRHDDDGELGLKAFLSLYLQPSSPVTDNKVVAMPSVVRIPECYVPHVAIPRVPLTEDSGDFSVESDSSVTTGSEKAGSTDENKVNIRVSSIPPPRAVISSPDILLEDMRVIFLLNYPLKFLPKGCNTHAVKMGFSDKSPNLLLCTSKGTETQLNLACKETLDYLKEFFRETEFVSVIVTFRPSRNTEQSLC